MLYTFADQQNIGTNKYPMKQIELINELSTIRADNKLNNELIQRYKKDYENLLMSYQFVKNNSGKLRSDDNFTFFKVKAKDSA